MEKNLLSVLAIIAAGTLLVSIGSFNAFGEVVKTRMDGIEVMSGGVGLDERQNMENMAAGYNVKLVFAMISGNYLSDIAVTISDSSGKRLTTVSNGPWLYAKMPQGRYTVEAVHGGKKKVRTVEVGTGMQVVMFHWKP